MEPIAKKIWTIAEGYNPSNENGPGTEKSFQETACILNLNFVDAVIEMMIFYLDNEPVGPYRIVVPARHSRNVSLNDLKDPLPIHTDTKYASVLVSNVPIMVQHTRVPAGLAEIASLPTFHFSRNAS